MWCPSTGARTCLRPGRSTGREGSVLRRPAISKRAGRTVNETCGSRENQPEESLRGDSAAMAVTMAAPAGSPELIPFMIVKFA